MILGLIIIVLALAFLYVRWGSSDDDFDFRIDPEDCQQWVDLECVSNIDFEITNVTLGSNAQITVISNGNQNIDSFSWNIIDSTGVVKGSGTTTYGLVAYGIENFTTTTTTVIGDKVVLNATITTTTPREGITCSGNCTRGEIYTVV